MPRNKPGEILMKFHGKNPRLEIVSALGGGDGQESLACCSPWGCKELDMTEGFNNKFPQDRSRQWLIFVVVWLFCFVWVCLFWWSAEGVVTV